MLRTSTKKRGFGPANLAPNKPNDSATIATIAAMEKRISELEEWIKAEGEHTDTCTYPILKRVCDGCRCGRLDTDAKSSQSSDEGGRGNARGMVDGGM